MSAPLIWKKKCVMRDWRTDTHATKSGWFWIEAAFATIVVISGYVGLGWTVFDWLADLFA